MVPLARSRAYQHATRYVPKANFGQKQRFETVGVKSMVETRHLFRQVRSDIAALVGGEASVTFSRNVFEAMGRNKCVFDQLNPAPIASPRDRGLYMSQRQSVYAYRY